jgi:hypothetical protein
VPGGYGARIVIVIGKVLALFVMLVIVGMTVASSQPAPTCMHGVGQGGGVEGCQSGELPMPMCCFEVEDLPEMLHSQVDSVVKTMAARLEQGLFYSITCRHERQGMASLPPHCATGPPRYLLYRAILC